MEPTSPEADPSAPSVAYGKPPGKTTAIGVMRLVMGILHVMGGGFMMVYILVVGTVGFFTTFVGCLAVF